jgi:hypothetical protein
MIVTVSITSGSGLRPTETGTPPRRRRRRACRSPWAGNLLMNQSSPSELEELATAMSDSEWVRVDPAACGPRRPLAAAPSAASRPARPPTSYPASRHLARPLPLHPPARALPPPPRSRPPPPVRFPAVTVYDG